MEDKLLFFASFLKYPKQVGSIIPSSRFMINEILKNIDFEKAKCIAEYGPGTGVITKEILKRARKDAKVLCFEINKKFCTHLKKKIKDERLIVINDSAENIRRHVKRLGIKNIDFIISSLPFSVLSKERRMSIVMETKNTLNQEGKFVLYQYLNNFRKYLKSCFPKISTRFIPLNIPPCFVYVCEK